MKKGTVVRISFLDHCVASARTDGKPVPGIAVGYLREETSTHFVLCSMVLGALDDDDSTEMVIVKTPGIKVTRLVPA